jgi:hypothetical protein
MDKYYVLVAGNGATSRANIEALMEDHYYANGEDGIVVMPIFGNPTPSQVFVAQYAKEKNKEVVYVASEGANLTNLPAGSMINDPDPINKAVEIIIGEKTTAFLLWSDEDNTSLDVLVACKKADIKCFDLTDGLVPINPSADIKKAEVIDFPEKERVTKSAKEDEDDGAEEEESGEEEEDDEEYEDEDEEDDEGLENLYAGVEEIARIFARAFKEEFSRNDTDTPKP